MDPITSISLGPFFNHLMSQYIEPSLVFDETIKAKYLKQPFLLIPPLFELGCFFSKIPNSNDVSRYEGNVLSCIAIESLHHFFS